MRVYLSCKMSLDHAPSSTSRSGPTAMDFASTLKNIKANWPEAATPQSACAIMVQRFAALLQANARSALAPHGLSFTEFETLATLRSSPTPHELNPTALYDALLISSGGLTKVLKSLEERGLVARPERLGDRRKRPIALTATGRRLAEAAMTSVQAADAAKLEGASFEEADYERLARSLGTLLISFDATV